MSTDVDGILRHAIREAMQVRRRLAIAREAAINIFDVAAGCGASVRFENSPSLEGMYLRDSPGPLILLPSFEHRPAGRITFSCAHELGHHILGHGTRVDEYVKSGADSGKSLEERAADLFAAYLLMPRQAVLARFAARGVLSLHACTSEIAMIVALELGVGYTSLLSHMTHTLHLLPAFRLDDLKLATPKDWRQEVTGLDSARRVVLVDQQWAAPSIDLEVDDYVACATATITSDVLASVDCDKDVSLYRAIRPGLSQWNAGATPCRVRVARKGYCGSIRHRFLPDPDSE